MDEGERHPITASYSREPFLASAPVRRARLVSGLTLMLFVVMHLANLSLGLASVEAMDRARAALLAPWQAPLGQALLLAAALVHAALGLAALGGRRTLRLSRKDWVQLVAGLTIPPLLVSHIVALQVADDIDPAYAPDYGFVLAVYWRVLPAYALLQLAAVLAVYLHGVIGLGAWLKLRPWWPRAAPLVLPLAFALPILALLGFAGAGSAVLARLDDDSAWAGRVAGTLARLGALKARLDAAELRVLAAYAAALLAALACLMWRLGAARREAITVRYEDGSAARGRPGLSVLEAGRLGGIPHAHVCGGRGRCGTCAVRPAAGSNLSPVGEVERATLDRIAAPPGVRLACQARLAGGDVAVERLQPVYADAEDARRGLGPLAAALGAEPAA